MYFVLPTSEEFLLIELKFCKLHCIYEFIYFNCLKYLQRANCVLNNVLNTIVVCAAKSCYFSSYSGNAGGTNTLTSPLTISLTSTYPHTTSPFLFYTYPLPCTHTHTHALHPTDTKNSVLSQK